MKLLLTVKNIYYSDFRPYFTNKNAAMQKLIYILTVIVLIFGCQNKQNEIDNVFVAPDMSIDWDYADSLQKVILLPQIPSDTFYVNDFGGMGNTHSVQRAIDKAFESGGGTVVISEGIHHSGPVVLKSRINLHIKKGSILRFIPDPELYPLVETWFDGIPCMNYSPMIFAENASDIKISGNGIIDGQGDHPAWKNMKYYEHIDLQLLRDLHSEGVDPINRKFGHGHSLRPNLIGLLECKKVQISGVELINTPLAAIHSILSDNIEISNIHINSLGFDQVGLAIESSENIMVDSVLIESVHDGIKILSGGRPRIPGNKPSRNIIIQNSEFINMIYSVVSISVATAEGASNIFVSDIKIDRAGAALKINSNAAMKAKLHDILFRNIHAVNISDVFVQMKIFRGIKRPYLPLIYNIELDKINVESGGRAFIIHGISRSLIQNIRFSESTFNTDKSSYVEDIKNLKLSSVLLGDKTLNGTWDIGHANFESISVSVIDQDDELLDRDRIGYSEMPLIIQNLVLERFPYIPVERITRIITRSNVVYEIRLNTESSRDLWMVILKDGEVLQTREEIDFDALPGQIVAALESHLKTTAVPFMMTSIYEFISYDLTYYELSGESDNRLFAVAITEDGEIIEAKHQRISFSFPY